MSGWVSMEQALCGAWSFPYLMIRDGRGSGAGPTKAVSWRSLAAPMFIPMGVAGDCYEIALVERGPAPQRGDETHPCTNLFPTAVLVHLIQYQPVLPSSELYYSHIYYYVIDCIACNHMLSSHLLIHFPGSTRAHHG